MRRLILSACLLLVPATTQAHVALQETSAPAGMKYTARLRVGHACGTTPTTALSIQIPAAILDATPYQQGGWTLASVRSGNRVSLVTWEGGSIAPGKVGDFNISMTLPRQPGTLAFPAIQTCGTTETAWTQIAAKPGQKLERPAPLLTLVAAGDAPVTAQPAGGLQVQDGWWRALPGSIPAGGYFTLRNNGRQSVALTGASSPACGSIMLHQTTSSGGMAGMNHVTSVDVPPGGSASFAPGGHHMMCMAPGPTMKPGGAVPVTLLFHSGAKLTVTFAVRNAAGR